MRTPHFCQPAWRRFHLPVRPPAQPCPQRTTDVNLIDLSLSTTAGNLALDQWLLDTADDGQPGPGVLRLWENPVPAVILGRSSRIREEVHVAECERRSIPVLRRVSGGASVVIGPGCLMYSIVLDTRNWPQLKMLDHTHRFVMARIRDAVARCGIDVRFQGTCDLTLDHRKVSGNSLRLKRHCLLYHGTLLHDFQVDLLGHLLGTPPRQPDYRDGRPHAEFVTNLPVGGEDLKRALAAVWQAASTGQPRIDRQAVGRLVQDPYSRPSWTHSR